jgi:hypothetical protein
MELITFFELLLNCHVDSISKLPSKRDFYCNYAHVILNWTSSFIKGILLSSICKTCPYHCIMWPTLVTMYLLLNLVQFNSIYLMFHRSKVYVRYRTCQYGDNPLCRDIKTVKTYVHKNMSNQRLISVNT